MNIKKLIKNSVLVMLGSFYISNSSLATNTEVSDNIIKEDLFIVDNIYITKTIETQDKEVITIGYYDSSDIVSGYDGVIMKHDSNGECIWLNKMEGSEGRLFFQSGVLLDNGDIIVVGDDEDSTDIYALIIKYDKDGNLIWKKTLDSAFFYSAEICSDGNIVAVGGNGAGVIVKYDIDGNLLWNKDIKFSKEGIFHSVKETKDRGFIIVGISDQNIYDGLIIKCDKDGNLEWFKNWGGSRLDEFNSVIETSDGDFIVVGNSNSTNADFINKGSHDAIIVKYDNKGNQEWIKSFGGSMNDYFELVIETSSGGYIAVGRSFSTDAGFTNKGSIDIITVKYDKDGNQEWIKGFGSSRSDECYLISESSEGNLEMIAEFYFNETEGREAGYYLSKIYYNKDYEELFEIVANTESVSSISDLKTTRELVNNIPEGIFKEYFQDRLNSITITETLERKTATANLDIYIKSENMLSLTLDTNSVTFEDFSGVEDMESLNTVNLIVNSSLPYQINAYMPTEIQNADKTNTMNKDILNIRANGESNYNTFVDTINPIVLLDNQPADNNVSHGVDLMLKGSIAHEKDIYKTTIKFEAVQK